MLRHRPLRNVRGMQDLMFGARDMCIESLKGGMQLRGMKSFG